MKTTKFTAPAFHAPGTVIDSISRTGQRVQIQRIGEAELNHVDGSTYRTPQQFLDGFPNGVLPVHGEAGWTWASIPHFSVRTAVGGTFALDTDSPKAYFDLNEAMRDHGLFTATVYTPVESIEVGTCVETITYHHHGVVIDANHAAPDETWLAAQRTPFRPEALERGYPWIKLLIHGGQKALVPLYDVVAVEPFLVFNPELDEYLRWTGTGYELVPDRALRTRRFADMEILARRPVHA